MKLARVLLILALTILGGFSGALAYYQWLAPSNLSFQVSDGVTGAPIQATVTLANGVSAITDGRGYANFNLNPGGTLQFFVKALGDTTHSYISYNSTVNPVSGKVPVKILMVPAPAIGSTCEPGGCASGSAFAFNVYIDGSNYLASKSKGGGNAFKETSFQTLLSTDIPGDAVCTSGCGIYFQPGTFTVDGKITVPDGMHYEAGSRQATSLTAKNNLNDDLFLVTGSNIVFKHLTINGNKAQQTTGSCINFSPTSAQNEALVDDLQITSCKTSGIKSGEGSTSTYKNIRIDHTLITGSGSHNIDIGSNGADTVVDNSEIVSAGGSNIFLSSTSGIFVANSHVYSATTDGVNIASSSEINIVDNNINNNNQAGIRIQTTAFDITVTGNDINGNSFGNVGVSDGIRITSSSNVTIGHNTITDSQSTKSQNYGIAMSGTNSRINVQGNTIANWVTAAMLIQGTNNIIRGNTGWITENQGTCSITVATSCTVTHSLAASPTSILVASQTSTTACLTYWVDTIGATSFKINIASSSTCTMSWQALYWP